MPLEQRETAFGEEFLSMPHKYVIHTRTVPNRFKKVTPSGIIAWEEGCLKCAVCVKKRCVYQVYEHRGLDSRHMVDAIDNECMNCLRCVQGCPKELIHKSVNPEYKDLGDDYWSPDTIARLWYQAETGKIPVSGAGYSGPFSGSGFDAMWTDMSEIVRPTRDGIHGREYISTAVDIGRMRNHLKFDPSGNMVENGSSFMSIPLPILMRTPPLGAVTEAILEGWAVAADRLGTCLALPHTRVPSEWTKLKRRLIPILSSETVDPDSGNRDALMVEMPWTEDWETRWGTARSAYPSSLISFRLPLVRDVEKRSLRLARAGVPVLHLEAGFHGRAQDDERQSLRKGIRSVHQALVRDGIRDEVTLLAGGGIAMAEHVAKAIICGADAVYVDMPILLALECRMCLRCTKELACPVDMERASATWVARRTVNLLGAWHNQLLEVMGAMGMRDARRMRGEAGRAMFFEELDALTFDSMGEVKQGWEIE
jgi:ferredoxin